MSVHCYDIACCGVAFSDGGKWLCAGDLSGGVWVMEENNSKSLYNCLVSDKSTSLSEYIGQFFTLAHFSTHFDMHNGGLYMRDVQGCLHMSCESKTGLV